MVVAGSYIEMAVGEREGKIVSEKKKRDRQGRCGNDASVASCKNNVESLL